MTFFKTNLLISFFLLIFTWPAMGLVNLGLSGALSNSNFSLETHKKTSISANVSLGLGSYFHIGLTHRRSFDNKSGFKKTRLDENTIAYIPFEDNTEIITNSVDLTIFLYEGQISPFVFGGVAKRDYVTEISYLEQQARSSTTLFPVPNYGLGLAIQLTRNFHLKITQTYTPGIRTVLEDGQEKSETVKDSYTQLGIGYKI